jgi:predicted TIM-barrel fold metal-dependent hydrolase
VEEPQAGRPGEGGGTRQREPSELRGERSSRIERERRDPWYGKRIDLHTHIFDDVVKMDDRELERKVRLARQYGIRITVMLGHATSMLTDSKPNPTLVRNGNTYTLRAMERYPDEIIGFCYLNPVNPIETIEEELERCIVKRGMKGVKLLTAINVRDRRVEPLLERVQSLGVPLVHHSWYKTTPMGMNESKPSDLANLADRFPKVPIILAHMGGIRQRGILDIKDHPNMCVDTSGSQPEDGLVEYAVKRLGAERIFYGSDWPVRDYGVQIGRILGANIADREKELIFYGNITRLLDLG